MICYKYVKRFLNKQILCKINYYHNFYIILNYRQLYNILFGTTKEAVILWVSLLVITRLHSWASIPKIPVVPRHQAITSRVDHAPLLKALSRTLKNISTYRRASPSFAELSAPLFACSPSRGYLSRAERTSWISILLHSRQSISGWCTQPILVSTTRMSHVRFMPFRTWREFRWISG